MNKKSNDLQRSQLNHSDIVKQIDQYEELLNNLNDIIYIIDTEGNFTYINSAVTKILGYSYDEIIGKNMSLFIISDSLLQVKEMILKERNYPGTELNYEVQVKSKSGEILTFEIRSFTNKKEGKPTEIFGIARDITQRKFIENKVLESDKKYRDLIEQAADSIFIINSEGQILLANSKTCEMLGYSLNELYSINIFDTYPDEYKKDCLERLKNYKRNENVRFERPMLRKDGSIFFAEASVTVLDNGNIQEIVHDITERKESEEALKRSEAFLENIIERSPYPMWISDEKGTLIKVNKSLRELLHLKNEGVVGKYNVFEDDVVIQQGLVPLIREVYDKGKSIQFYLKYDSSLVKNLATDFPTLVILLVNFSAVLDSNGKVKNAIIQHIDITERILAEEALKRSETFLDSIIEHSPYSMWISDDKGTLIRLNQACRDLMNIKDEEVIGKYNVLRDNILEEQGYLPLVKNVFEKGETAKFLLKYDSSTLKDLKLDKKVSVIIEVTISPVLDTNGKVVNAVIQHNDITERILAEEALKESETKFRSIFENSIDAIFVSKGGTIIFINPAFLALFHYESGTELIGKSLLLLIAPEEKEKIISIFEKKLKEDRTENRFETRGLTKDGIEFELSVNISWYELNSEKYTLGILRDISEQKKNEKALLESNRLLENALEELKRTQHQVLQQERLRALGQMASGIAHDINNSLMPILGYSDLLLNDERISQIAKTQLTKIKTASQDIRRIIERMKEFYRPKIVEAEYKNLKINDIINSAIDLTKHRWKDIPESQGAVIEIKVNLEDNLPFIKGDDSEIREALTNLILNASDAMPKGGVLSISSYFNENVIIVVIQDNGIGMDEETRLHCLDPFYSTKGDKGTGLGLSMVYGIMQRHGGQIEIFSEENTGTRINLIFPTHSIIGPADLYNEEVYSIPHLKILCIDDDNDVRETLINMLQNGKHLIEVSDSGKKGIEIFYKNYDMDNSFDLVITDLGMPYMDGKSVSESIKNKSPYTPIILMTGWGAFIEKDSIKTVDYILKKPLTINELNKAIVTVLNIKAKKKKIA